MFGRKRFSDFNWGLRIRFIHQTAKSYNRSIKQANYDGTDEWRDYKSHFDACAAINDWDNEEKGLYLAAVLRSQAQCVLGDLPSDHQVHYASLVEAGP
jgi:hypothetical protein